ncbi:MAG TPA: cupin domain-containing protein [Patescibacteria group bacterium]|nr:cupin domain-containing protein [Patescibacteria group bacterium]
MTAYRLMPERTVTDKTGRKICEVFGAADGLPGMSVAWLMLPAGCGGVDERNGFDEAVIVLSGKGKAWLDGAASEVGAGHAIHVPKGALWRLENTGREPLVCYSVCSPAFRPELSQRPEPV